MNFLRSYLKPTAVVQARSAEDQESSNVTSVVHSSAVSTRSRGSSTRQVEEIRHKVILNHIWHKQNALAWISNHSGECEGVIIRKSRDEYLCRPAALANSTFARAVADMNLQVSILLRVFHFISCECLKKIQLIFV